MRKRSKRRIPQDVKPWVKVSGPDDESFALFDKKTTSWISGSRKNRNTKVLNAAIVAESSFVLYKSLIKGLAGSALHANVAAKLNNKLISIHKMSSLSKYKNFCLFSGRGRTYNRALGMARHYVRKLGGVASIAGLIK